MVYLRDMLRSIFDVANGCLGENTKHLEFLTGIAGKQRHVCLTWGYMTWPYSWRFLMRFLTGKDRYLGDFLDQRHR